MKTQLELVDLSPILGQWAIAISGEPFTVTRIPGGLSGAQIWRISLAGQNFCLRRWPSQHPSPDQLRTIHQGVEHVWQSGLHIVPVPHKTLQGDSFLLHEDHLWEISPWLAGEPLSSCNPHPIQRTAAVDALAKFHQAAKYFGSTSRNPLGPAPGLLRRREHLAALLQGHLAELTQAVQLEPPTALRETMLQLLSRVKHALPDAFVEVEKCSKAPLPLQWCLRDVHPGNLLFTGNLATGIVDFGAASFDSIAGDIARLVGGFSCDSQERQWYLQAYADLSPLTDSERRAVPAFHAAGLISAAANWIRWLVVERNVPMADTTQSRLVDLSGQLSRLDGWHKR